MYARHGHKENIVIDSLSGLTKIVDHLVNLPKYSTIQYFYRVHASR